MEIETEVAIARVKDYIPDSKNLIKYSDLYERLTNQVLRDAKSLVYGKEYPSAAVFEQAIADNLKVLSVMLPTSVVAVKWASDMHYGPMVESLEKIANRKIEKPREGYRDSLSLNHTVDTLYLYGLGIACVYYKKYGLLDLFFRIQFDEFYDLFSPYIIDKDNCWLLNNETWDNTAGNSRIKTPFSTTLCRSLRQYFDMINNEEEFEAVFCIFEKLLAMYYYCLISKKSSLDLWPPIGCISWMPFYFERSRIMTFKHFFEEVNNKKGNSLVIKDGMFEGDYALFEEANKAVDEYIKQSRA